MSVPESYTIKAMIKDLANFKDFTSMSMKDTAQNLIRDILSYASNSDNETSDDYDLAKEFATEYMQNVTGIANDVLITSDNVSTDNPTKLVIAEPEEVEELPDEPKEDEEPEDTSSYDFLEIIDEEDESEEKPEDEDRSKAKEKLKKFLSKKE